MLSVVRPIPSRYVVPVKRQGLLIALLIGLLLMSACGSEGGSADGNLAEDSAAALSAEKCADFGRKAQVAPPAAGTLPDFDKSADAWREAKSELPGDLRDDADVFIAALRKVGQDLDAAGLPAGTAITTENAKKAIPAFSAVGTKEFTTASQNLGTWVSGGCK